MNRTSLAARAALVTLGLCPGLSPAAEAAASYPSKPVRLIVAQGPGSSVDNMGRVLALRLTEEWGKQVISPQIYKSLPYHPTKDFRQVSLIASTQNVLVMNANMPFRTVKELIAYAKANPGKLNMANAGSGFQSHLAGVLFAHMANIDVHHVPYKGGTSTTMVAAGESHLTIVPLPSGIAHIRSGRLVPLGTGGEKRSTQLPDVPTIAEAGVPGFVSTGWAGIVTPKAISGPLFDRIYATLVKAMNDSTTRELFERQGAEPMTSTPEQFLNLIYAEYGRFAQAIKLAGLKMQ